MRDFGTSPSKDGTASVTKVTNLPPPRIFIQRASDATDCGTPFSTPAATDPDKQLNGPDLPEESDRSSRSSQGADPVASRVAIPPEVTSNLSHGTEDLEKPKVKKRKIMLRKSRNAVMRKHFLQLCLGRQLAEHTKPALRLLAHGESVEGRTCDCR